MRKVVVEYIQRTKYMLFEIEESKAAMIAEIKKVIKEKEMPLRHVAFAIDASESTISRILRDKKYQASLEYVAKIAKGVGIDVKISIDNK